MSGHPDPTPAVMIDEPTVGDVVVALGGGPRHIRYAEQALEALRQQLTDLAHKCTLAVGDLDPANGEEALRACRNLAHHAAYSNTITTAAAEIVALASKITGLIEGIVE